MTADTWLSIIQTAAAVIGLPVVITYVWLMHRQTQRMTDQVALTERAIRSSVYQQVASQMIEIDRFFIEHPELRPYIYEGKQEEITEPDRSRVQSTAEMLVDFADNLAILKDAIPPYLYSAWKIYFREIFQSSPAIQRFWNENCHWFTDEMSELFDVSISKSS